MSSNIPLRRVTRATRLPDENAVKGRGPPARGVTKPRTTAVAGPSKPTTTGAALDANTQNKRKREALGELTNNNKEKNIPKGSKDGSKAIKPHVLIPAKPPKPAVKPPARKTRTTTGGLQNEVEEVIAEEKDEDAMVVDEPAHAPTLHRILRQQSRNISTTGATTSKTSVLTRRLVQNERGGDVHVPGHLPSDIVNPDKQGDDSESHRAFKRRRTSSEADVEAAVEAEVETEEPTLEGEPAQQGKQTNTPASVAKSEDEEQGWDDLDKDDFDDPYMVSEYVVDIFKYLSECEEQTLPNPNYIQHQAELRWNQRGVLMDYIIGLHHRFRMMPETLYLAVNIIDRFLSMRVVSLSKLQLVGLSGLFIASKFEDIVAPSVQNLLLVGAMKDDTSEDEMLRAERYILKTLNWSISLFPQPMNWLRRISKADDYDPQVRSLAKFFLEIHVVERRLLGVKPSLIAAASIWLGRLVTNQFGWTPNLAHYSGYREKKIIPVANIMLNYCLRPERHENFISKYGSKKYSKVGLYIHDWVTSRWTVGDKISLVEELPYLMTLAAERKE